MTTAEVKARRKMPLLTLTAMVVGSMGRLLPVPLGATAADSRPNSAWLIDPGRTGSAWVPGYWRDC